MRARRTDSRRRWQAIATAAVVVLGTVAGGSAPQAHHGWSGYEASKLLTLTGTVRSAAFESPHGVVALESGGKVWRVILAPPSRLQRRGLPPGSIQPGQEATVEGYAHRSDPAELRAERIRVDGGEAVELR